MKRYRSILLACAVAVGAAMAAAPAQAAEPTQCTASFHVLHDDRIGSLQLPHGVYQLETNELTCTKASALFAQFLQDYNGVLPKPWRYSAQGTGQGTFTRTSRQYRSASEVV